MFQTKSYQQEDDNKNKIVTRLEVLRLLFFADREREDNLHAYRVSGENNRKQSLVPAKWHRQFEILNWELIEFKPETTWHAWVQLKPPNT